MKKNHTFRAAAAILTAAMTLTCLTGCSQNGGSGNSSGNGGANRSTGKLEVSLDHSYSAEKINLEDMSYFSNTIPFGDKVILSGSDKDYNEVMVVYDPADGSTKSMKFGYPETLGEGSEAYPVGYYTNEEQQLTVLFSAYSWSADENGEEQYEDLGMTMETYDADLNVIDTHPVGDVFGEDISINQILPIKDGYLISLWNNTTGNIRLGIYDKDLKKTKDIQLKTDYINSMFTGTDGTAYVSYYPTDGNSEVFATVDTAAGTLNEAKIENLPRWFNRAFSSSDENYDFYLSETENVYGINVKNGTCEPVINWLNSDFMGNSINEVVQLPDKRFLVTSYSMNQKGPSESTAWLLSPRDPDAFKDVQMITMAGLGLPDDIGQSVLEFNRTHDDCRIAMVNYEQYSTDDDYEAGINKLKNDMTSGIVADLILTAGVPYESLANKGIFEDLTPYMSSYTDADYFMNFFDSLKYGDKLYQIGFSYSVDTMVGKKEVVGDKQGLNISEYMDMIDSLPSGMKPFSYASKTNALQQFVISDLKAFTDVKTGTCTFNSPEFVRTLEFCNSLPNDEEMDQEMSVMSEEDQQKYWAEQEYEFINNKTALSSMYISDIKEFYRQEVTAFDEADTIRIGFPVAGENSGNGGRFSVYGTMAMSANSAVKDQCWEFMSSMLSDEHQDNLSWSLPVKRSAYEKMAEEAMKPDYYEDENGKKVEQPITIWRGDEEVEVPLMPKSYADELKTYIEGIRTCSYYDMTIYNIIQEETEKYFAGDQTSQQAADMIQSRVSLYLSEQS
ncbi:MAG: hypothetical protein II916_01805 [Oscillospiraceae bacterium]|nr:hypothetical protein [Oscillospiraceae bacterium]